jgi:hypothetical protein
MSLLQAGGTVKAGKEEAYRLELEGKQDQIATTAREADRKRELAKALASQNALAGARGIAAFEGSPLAIMQEDMAQEVKATERDWFEQKLRHRQRRGAARNAKDAAYLQAGTGLLMSALSMAGSMGGGSPASSASATGGGKSGVLKSTTDIGGVDPNMSYGAF